MVKPDVFTVVHEFDSEGDYIGVVTADVGDTNRMYRAVFPFEVGYTGLGYWPYIIGLFVLGVLNNGLDHVDIDSFLKVLIRGLILLAAIVVVANTILVSVTQRTREIGVRRAVGASRAQILAEILEPRMEEIFTLVQREIYRAGMENAINSGIVITGGTALLDGITDVAEGIFNLPTRLGRPSGISGLVDVVNNPMYATGVGLVLYGARMQPEKKFRIRDKNIFNGIMGRMKKWFKDVI